MERTEFNKVVEDVLDSFTIEQRHVVDSMTIFHVMEPRNLAAAYQFYCGKTLQNGHSALADVSATVEVLCSQLAKYKDLPTTVADPAGFGGQTREQYADAGRWFIRRNGDLIFTKGKHRGKPLAQVASAATDYLEWMVNNCALPEDSAKFVQQAIARAKSKRDTPPK
jgi:DNA polymerase-3 subunit epsilon